MTAGVLEGRDGASPTGVVHSGSRARHTGTLVRTRAQVRRIAVQRHHRGSPLQRSGQDYSHQHVQESAANRA